MVSPAVRQAWTVSGVLLNMVGQGMVLSFPSCFLPALLAPDSPVKVDLDTASWLASSMGLSSLLGFVVSSFLMGLWGRKITHALVIVPGTLGWLTICMGNTVPAFMAGRILGGITAGATVTLGAIVIGEYTSPKYRGTFLNLKTAAVCFGNMMSHIIGYFYHWRVVAICGLIPHIVAFGIVCMWPESPAWLASKKQFEKSEKSFFWLRGTNDDSVKEFERMILSQKELSKEKASLKRSVVTFFKKFTRRDFVKPVFIIMFAAILLEACGRHMFPAYASQIMSEITGENSKSFYFTLGIDLIITASATFSSVLVSLMKRRTLLFLSGITSLIVLASVCTYLFLVSKEIIRGQTWIPMVLFVVYFILANLGCTPIPMALLGEIFPLAHRGAGAAVSGLMLSMALMTALQVTPAMLVSLKVYGTFAVYGIFMAVSVFMLYLVLPETKDRTLQEIEEYFNYGRFKDDDSQIKDDGANMKMIG